jgi:quinol-cytochrome oxidoreductase complex cytochrome b subunit
MVRVIIFTAFVATFAMFGALGAQDIKSQLTCILIAMTTCGLGIWRAAILYRRIIQRNEGQRLFNEYMRRNMR